jgi:GTP-binding protein
MKQISSYPKVLLVGRMNVGKSTLFNRLANEKKSIVFSREGVTRDAIHTTLTWNDKTFTLVDTGGMTFDRHADMIQKKVQDKVVQLLDQGDIILFVCDGKSGLTHEDEHIGRLLHRLKKPVFLLINKADNSNRLEETFHEFYQLGFDKIIKTSGVHGSGLGPLLYDIVEALPEKKIEEEDLSGNRYKLAIIGKPNVGKSSLMNLLIKQDRSIVSDVAGTTRESIKEEIDYKDYRIQIIDTAGVRRKRSVNDDLEELMVKSSMEAVRTSHTIIIVVDASQGAISDQEIKLLFYAYEEKKNILVIFNKMDLVDEYTHYQLDTSIDEYDFIFKKIPMLFISCMTKKNVGKIFAEVDKIHSRNKQILNSSDVNEVIQEALKHKPLYHSRQPLRLFKIRVVPGIIPSFVLHVNHPNWFDSAALGCIENILRKTYDLKGCPLNFNVRKV